MSVLAGSEMFISCTARGMRQGQKIYLVELLRNYETMVTSAHSILIPQSDKMLRIPVVNSNS